MNEVRQAWSSLLSSRTLMTSGCPIGNSASSASSGGNANSSATWYDAPAPVIVHNRKFREEAMEPTKTRFHENKDVRGDSNPLSEKSCVKTPKQRNSRDSATETVASLRRAFLDDFRRSNEQRSDDNTDGNVDGAAVDKMVVESGKFRVEANLSESSIRSVNRVPGAVKDELIYQNNVEAALNSPSKICAKELDASVESTIALKNSRDNAELDDDEGEVEEEGNEDISGDSSTVRVRRRRRTTSDGGRRHSSSVELTAMTSVETGEDGIPTVSFSFLRSEENSRTYIRDITLDDQNCPETISPESSEITVGEQLYDFPKSGRGKIIEVVEKLEIEEDGGGKTIIEKDNEDDGTVDIPEVRLLGDGSVAADLPASSSEDRLYDFPKSRGKAIKIFEIDNFENPSRSALSTSTVAPETNDELLYEAPICPENSPSSTLSKVVARSAQKSNREGERRSRADQVQLTDRDRRKLSYRSLRSGRSIGTTNDPEVDASGAVQAYYSDPEIPEVGNAEEGVTGNRSKTRRHHRLGKAWGRMRSWLREEKSRFGEVVNRHAKMQAVGALRSGRSEDGSSLGSRCGSYDLIEARTRELGSITRVEEFGLSSVSEEGNVSEPERAEPNSYDLRMNADTGEGIGNAGENGGALDGRTSKLDTSDDPPDGDIRSGRLRKKTLSTDNVLGGTRIKLIPVSFSLDKLFDDEGNDESTTRRDNVEQTREHGGKGGLIKRRMLGSIRGLMASTHLLQQHEPEEGGPGGFEDVRRYVKQGGDFCKELAAVLHERAELEASYSKGLSKLSGKLTKACTKDQGGIGSGGVTEAWRSIGEEMEAAAEAHRAWGIALSEQLAKPLRVGVAEAQGRSRKVIESSVDKASKSLQEWRGIAVKSKKQSFSCARENERLQDLARIQSISQSQQNNNKTSSHHMTEKEVNKLETRRRKAEDSSRRADTEFYTVSVRAERARLEYESTVRKGAKQMELLEEERLSALKDLANVYLAHLQALAPRLQQSADRLSSPVRNCSVSQDVDILKNVIRRLDSNDASNVDQLLPDFYAEHVTLAMNRERRKQSLVRVLHLIRQDLERERRGREGLETLHRAFIQTPAFAADESTQNVTEKLHHMRSMLTFLEAARYKVGGTLAEVEGGKRGKHPLAEHILVSRDKQGLQQSVLKVPSWAKNESFEFPESQDELDLHLTKDHESERRDWVDRTAGDGNSENPPDEEDFSDFDEFSSQSEDNNNQEVEIADITEKGDSIEQCRAIYQYSANLNDELSLTPGDLITIQEKQADGWWIGECGGRTGIFPATYVQIIH